LSINQQMNTLKCPKIHRKGVILLLYGIYFLPVFAFSQLFIATDVYIDRNATMHVAVKETTFDQGEVITDRSQDYGKLSFAKTSDWSNASNSTHVNGFVRMYSEDSFIFPVGNDGVFQSARIRRIDASSPVDFSFNVMPFGNYDIEKGITKIHESFYWNVVGSQPAYLSLSWNALSAIDALTNNNLENLIIAGYDGNSWRYIESKVDLNTYFDNSPSSLLEGSITSVNPINLEGYTAFTLATRDSAGLRLNISQGFTPNGDGINDTWFIENIESFPNAQITVISRWGRIVFESPGQYQNDWNGVFQDNLEPLPDGSYAYTIDLEGDGKLDLHGWIYITR